MKKLIAILLLLQALAGFSTAMANEEMRLDVAPIKPTDVVSLQSGARTFANYCLNCHSASLMRWNRLLEIGLSESQIKDNLMFSGEKVGEMMNVAMDKNEATKWFGTSAPDLSVVARSRGADWLYTYLRGFYRDAVRPTGWNNVAFENVGMPHALWQLQGERVRIEEVVKGEDGKDKKDGHGNVQKHVRFEYVKPGMLTPVQYDETVRDLVNFLVYVAEPGASSRKQIGVIVLFVLGFLFVLAYLLKKEFWKDVH